MPLEFDFSDPKFRHVVLYSGGLDSFLTLQYIRKGVSPKHLETVFFWLGHCYGEQELYHAAATHPEMVIDNSLESLGGLSDESAFIPARNAHLVLGALKYFPRMSPETAGERGIVWLTVQKDEMSLEDRSISFLDRMSSLATWLSQRVVTVATPWADCDKTDMVRWYLDNNGSVDALTSTWSCYVGRGDMHCGDCPACIRRYIAFSLNHVSENYWQSPKGSRTARRYVEAARKGEYSLQRCERILKALA